MKGIGSVRTVRRKVSSGLLIAVLALAIPMSLIGRAHTFRSDTRVTIRYGNVANAFRGHVFSGREFCRENRTVRLFKVRQGPDFFVGTDQTNQSGDWRIPRANPHGNFYARAPRKVSSGYNHSHTCLRDRSPTIFVQ